jgi:uncharacterized protein (DUF433 family)
MPYPYVEERDSNVSIGKTRVTLDAILIPWLRGETPDQLHEAYPTVPLVDVYGTIAYYLENREKADHYPRETEELWRKLIAKQEAEHGEFLATMRKRCAEVRVRVGMESLITDETARI